jgi:hypothetical protein
MCRPKRQGTGAPIGTSRVPGVDTAPLMAILGRKDYSGQFIAFRRRPSVVKSQQCPVNERRSGRRGPVRASEYCRIVSTAHSPTLRQLSERWKITIVLGVIFVAVGIVAIVVPAAASVSVAIFLGWVLVFGAIVQLFSAFSVEGKASLVMRLVLTIVMAAAGIYLMVAPLKGTVTLTVVLTVWFIATGVLRLFTAFRDRGTPAARVDGRQRRARDPARDLRGGEPAELGVLGDRPARRARLPVLRMGADRARQRGPEAPLGRLIVGGADVLADR